MNFLQSIQFKKLLSFQYLFGLDRIALGRSDYGFLSFGVALVVGAFVLKIMLLLNNQPISKKLLSKCYRLSATIGILEVLWFGARYENVKFFSSHFVALLIILFGFIWLAFILIYWLRHYPVEVSLWQKEQLKLKYLSK